MCSLSWDESLALICLRMQLSRENSVLTGVSTIDENVSNGQGYDIYIYIYIIVRE